MNPWALPWWGWLVLAVALYIAKTTIYGEGHWAWTVRFCFGVAIFLSALVGVVQFVRLAW
ncbi:MAG: hypothetical protein ABSD98_10560 [Candidatus Korobacteraceae bacterium]|jgi:hypothetical protein